MRPECKQKQGKSRRRVRGLELFAPRDISEEASDHAFEHSAVACASFRSTTYQQPRLLRLRFQTASEGLREPERDSRQEGDDRARARRG